MKIDQRKDYDAEFCGSIPLNFINLIQAYGILLVVDKKNLHIRQVSQNFEDVTGFPIQDFLNMHLGDFVNPEDLVEIQNKAAAYNVMDKIPMDFSLKLGDQAIDFSSLVHFKEAYILMEWEKKDKDAEEFASFKHIYHDVRFIMAAIKDCSSIKELGDIVTAEIKKLSGFDRILLYQFDKDWNGKVISENKISSMQSYLGLQFPASDIPKSARDLYFKNPFRLIPDRDFVPVKLMPVINPVTLSFTDLSECNLRSVPKVHIEYMGNMEIKASMSIPIIVNNKLWGLISCHHQEAKFLNYEMKAAFELLSEIISAQITAKEAQKTLEKKSLIQKINLSLIEQIYEEDDFIKGLMERKTNILDLLGASGAAIFYNDRLTTVGKIPSEEQIGGIMDWLERYRNEKIFATDCLPKLYDKASEFKDACSGLLKIHLEPGKSNMILCFREEVVENVSWGGNPNEAITFDPDSTNYHPRNSFKVWKETVSDTALSWDDLELEVAENIRNAIIEKVLREHV